MKYEIVDAKSTSSLDEQVNTMIKLGYVPQGGVSIAFDRVASRREYVFVQAMVKTDD